MTIARLDLAALPRPPLHQAPAVRAGGFLFFSGLMAAEADGRLAEGARVPDGLRSYVAPGKRQARLVLDRLRRACAEAGTALDRVVKAQVFLTDLGDLPDVEEVWREAFAVPPARTVVATRDLPIEGARVLVEAIALDGAGTRPEPVAVDEPPLDHASAAVRAGPFVFLSGRAATDARTGLAPEVRPAGRRWLSPIKLEAAYALERLARTLAAAGSSPAHVVKAQVFLRDLRDFPAFDEVWRECFPVPPPRTTVGVPALPVPDARVAIDLTAIRADSPWPREVLDVPPGVPAPLAHYAVGVRVGPWVFAAGQIASDYRTGVPPEARVPDAFPYYGIAIKRQARYVLGNLRPVLAAGGASLARTVRAQVFLEDFADLPALEEVWREHFPDPVPRTVVGTTGLLVPGTRVEIDLTALAG